MAEWIKVGEQTWNKYYAPDVSGVVRFLPGAGFRGLYCGLDIGAQSSDPQFVKDAVDTAHDLAVYAPEDLTENWRRIDVSDVETEKVWARVSGSAKYVVRYTRDISWVCLINGSVVSLNHTTDNAAMRWLDDNTFDGLGGTPKERAEKEAAKKPARKHNHYFKVVAHLKVIDVYRVLRLFGVTDPCLQHAIKKLLVAGGRGGGKDIVRDIKEALDTLNRWLEMNEEDADAVPTQEAAE